MSSRIPYGLTNFKRLREEGYYYVDKTAYIRKLEDRSLFTFFVRPRRFGKSLFIDMLRCYYDISEKDNFQTLFGSLDIGKNPTESANRFLVLVLDFSMVNVGYGQTLEEKFEVHLSQRLDDFLFRYSAIFDSNYISSLQTATANKKFTSILSRIKSLGHSFYLIIDEYDNFTNEMLRASLSPDYRSITHGTGFYRNWFKVFKGTCDRIFMTGVSPVTMDDLTSGFNIATNLSQEEDFNAMLGFSEEEVVRMYSDFKGTGEFTEGDPTDIVRRLKPYYDGYCFAEGKIGRESVFNSDMALYYLKSLVHDGCPPGTMLDVNIRTDYDKLQAIADIQKQLRADTAEDVMPITEELATTGQIAFDLVDSFPAEKIAEEANFKSLFFYYGILSMSSREKGHVVYRVPNVCIKRQLFDYIRNAYNRTRSLDWGEWNSLATAFAYDGDWRPFLERLASDFAATTPVRGGIQGEIRIQGYMQAEFGHLKYYLMAPEMELSRGFTDFALFPERVYYGDCPHSYLIELKFSAANASDDEIEKKHREAVEQLAAYRADRFVPSLAAGTMLHQLVFQFRGPECVCMQEIAAEQL